MQTGLKFIKTKYNAFIISSFDVSVLVISQSSDHTSSDLSVFDNCLIGPEIILIGKSKHHTCAKLINRNT